MDGLMMPINVVANMVLAVAFTMFIIFVFGRTNSRIYQLPWYKTILVKAGLCLCTVGAFLNALTLSDPQASEVILNVGLGIMFTWAAWFHYRTFVIPYKQTKKQETNPLSIAKVSHTHKPRKKTSTIK